MSEFDYWSKDALNVLVSAFEEDETPPPIADTAFWEDLAERCRAADDTGEVSICAEDLAQDVRRRDGPTASASEPSEALVGCAAAGASLVSD